MYFLFKNFFRITYNRSLIKFIIIMVLNFFVFFFEFVSLISVIPLISLIFENSENLNEGLNYFLRFFHIFFNDLTIKNLVVFVIALSISKFFVHFFSIYLQEKFTLKSCQSIQKNILNNIIRSNYGYLIKLKTTRISNYIFPEINRVRVSCIALNSFLYNFMSIIVLFIGSTFINIYFSLISVVLGVFYFSLLSPINFFFSKQGKIQRNTRNAILQKIQIMFNNFKNFKIINKNSLFINEISYSVENLFKSEIRLSIVKAIVRNLYEPVLIILALLLIYYFYTSLTFFQFSELGALFLIFSRIFSRFGTMVQAANKFYLGKSSLIAINEQERSSFENKEISSGQNILKIDDIEFKNCYFSYGDKNVFSNLNFKIKKGTICSIYGKSGSGKTTIADLLVGLINIKDGEILLNSQNMKNFNILSLRQKIGYVTQDSYLFNGSLRYNISLSNDNDKDKDISSILEMLELKSLFLDEKINLDKNIYDKALNISGGQKQRILIAREMHKKPDVIIFDETLSQLHKDIRLRVFDIVKKLNPQITILNLTHNDEFKKISEQVLEI